MKTIAGIVLFQPDLDMLKKNIESVIDQVDEVYLFDNGSDDSEKLSILENSNTKITLYRNGKNSGIAYALNSITTYAKDKGYQWVLTLDQDSICSPNMINEYAKYIHLNNVAIICPFVLNNTKFTLEEYRELSLPEYEYVNNPNDCITSACLCNIDLIEKLGGYDNKLFIDYVDTEINCRIAKYGYKIIRANRAYLIQSMGKAKKIRLFELAQKITGLGIFRRMKVASVYNDRRLFYQARNSKYVYKKYGKKAGIKLHPLYMYFLFIYFTIVYPKDHNRITMWKSICSGRKAYREMTL